MRPNQQKNLNPVNLLGLFGVLLWVLTIFLRETPAVHNPGFHLWLGIAPNFGAALLLPALLNIYYPVVFKRALTRQHFLEGLGIIFTGLVVSEVVHEIFLGSRFDLWDLAASLVGLMIMTWVSGKTKEFHPARDHFVLS